MNKNECAYYDEYTQYCSVWGNANCLGCRSGMLKNEPKTTIQPLELEKIIAAKREHYGNYENTTLELEH